MVDLPLILLILVSLNFLISANNNSNITTLSNLHAQVDGNAQKTLVQSFITQFLTQLNSGMNWIIKQLFTPNDQWLSGHKTEALRRTAAVGSNQEFCKKICLIFHKMNRCHHLLKSVVLIPL